jgi:cytolysin (calcineurin-like family phosphatase)
MTHIVRKGMVFGHLDMLERVTKVISIRHGSNYQLQEQRYSQQQGALQPLDRNAQGMSLSHGYDAEYGGDSRILR